MYYVETTIYCIDVETTIYCITVETKDPWTPLYVYYLD